MTLRMHAQGVAHFKDIRYTDGITYGEMFLQNEYEMGRYNLEEADVATQRTRFELYEQVRPPRVASLGVASRLGRVTVNIHLSSGSSADRKRTFHVLLDMPAPVWLPLLGILSARHLPVAPSGSY